MDHCSLNDGPPFLASSSEESDWNTSPLPPETWWLDIPYDGNLQTVWEPQSLNPSSSDTNTSTPALAFDAEIYSIPPPLQCSTHLPYQAPPEVLTNTNSRIWSGSSAQQNASSQCMVLPLQDPLPTYNALGLSDNLCHQHVNGMALPLLTDIVDLNAW